MEVGANTHTRTHTHTHIYSRNSRQTDDLCWHKNANCVCLCAAQIVTFAAAATLTANCTQSRTYVHCTRTQLHADEDLCSANIIPCEYINRYILCISLLRHLMRHRTRTHTHTRTTELRIRGKNDLRVSPSAERMCMCCATRNDITANKALYTHIHTCFCISVLP